jgi:hypothetical protein
MDTMRYILNRALMSQAGRRGFRITLTHGEASYFVCSSPIPSALLR